MKYFASCVVAIPGRDAAGISGLATALAPLGLTLQTPPSDTEAPQFTGEFEVCGRAWERHGDEFLRCCLVLKVTEKLAGLRRPCTLAELQVRECGVRQ